MHVRLLGSGGFMPTDQRETACVYVREGDDVLLLDAGTGMRRLVTDPGLLEGVRSLNIALTHFHLDHTAGLVCVPALRGVPVRAVWAPGRRVAALSAGEVINRLLGPPFLAGTPDDVSPRWLTDIEELERDVEIGPFLLELRTQPLHNGPTLAFKVNGALAYCTDTAFDPENARFARGVTVLLHEAFYAADETGDHIHSAAGEAARVAAEAGVERLVLIHLNPVNRSDDELLHFARARFDAAVVGRDGLVLEA